MKEHSAKQTMAETPERSGIPKNRTENLRGREISAGVGNAEKIGVGNAEKIRKVPESLREALKSAMDVAISRIMVKVASKEGMPTDAKAYLTEIVAVLRETDAKLPKNHPLRGMSALVIENFLTPEEQGALFVRTALENGYAIAQEGKRLSAGPKEFDTGMRALRSTLGLAMDLAKRKPEKIDAILLEIKQIPEASELLFRFPDLETVLLKILPEIAKNVDKDTFLRTFDEFSKEIRDSALSILTGRQLSEKERADIAVKIAHESAKLVDSSITKGAVTAGVEGLSNLAAIRNSPLASKLLALVKRSELSDEDRFALVKKANEGVILFTKNPPDEKELEKYANSTFETVSKLSAKLPKDLVAEALAMIFRSGEKSGAKMEIRDSKELLALLRDNGAKLLSAAGKYVEGKWAKIKASVTGEKPRETGIESLEDFFRFALEERILETNMELARGELVERIKTIVEFDLSSFSIELKSRLSVEMPKEVVGKPKGNSAPAELKDALSNRVFAEMVSTFFWPDRPAKITKELLAKRVSATAAAAIDSLPGKNVKISGMDIPKSALKIAVTSPEFHSFAADAFAKLAGESGKNGASMEKLAAIVAAIMKDPLWNKYVGERTRQYAIDAFYSMPAGEMAEILSGNLENSGIAKYLKKPDGALAFDKRDITEMINILRDGEILPKEMLSGLLRKENLTPPIDAVKIFWELLASLSKERFSILLEKVCVRRADGSASLLEKGLSISKSENPAPPSNERIGEMIGLIFEAASKTDPETRKIFFERLATDSKTAEYGVTFLRAFGKERISAFAKRHPDVFSDVFSGKLDPRHDTERLLPLAVDVMYASDSATDAKLVSATKSAFPEFAGLLGTEVFWGTIADHLDRVRKAVPREKMLSFVTIYRSELASLGKNFDAAKAAKLAAALLLEVDLEKLVSLVDVSKLSGTERFAAEKLPQIQKALDSFRNETVQTPDERKVSRLDSLIESGIRIQEGKISPKEAEFFAGETFELLSRFLPTMGEWKIPEGGGAPSEAGERFKKEFFSNNLGFVLSQALPYLFGRPTEKIVEKYFADMGNKEAFIKTLSATVTGPRNA